MYIKINYQPAIKKEFLLKWKDYQRGYNIISFSKIFFIRIDLDMHQLWCVGDTVLKFGSKLIMDCET